VESSRVEIKVEVPLKTESSQKVPETSIPDKVPEIIKEKLLKRSVFLIR